MRTSVFQEILDGRYRLIRLLGEGGMGSVFLAQDVFEEDRKYALKILKADLKEEIEAFRREFELLAELRHPNIARVYTFGTVADSGSNYYTTEYIDGTDFYSATRDGNWEIFVNLTIQVCAALDYLHGRGILHRDIKPENILVCKDETGKPWAKLCDFGLAHRGDTQDVGFTGSLNYAAPELLKGGVADQKTDLYALGVILYQIATGELPFSAKDIAESIRMRLEVRPTRPSKYNPGFQRPFEDIILQLLEPRPEERPAGARAVARHLFENLQLPVTLDTSENLRATVHCGHYIERDEELKALKKIASEFHSSGIENIVMIQGPFGSGKTRLVQEWKTHCQLEGLPYYRARAREGEAIFVIRTWLKKIFGEPVAARKNPEKAKILAEYEGTLSTLLPKFYPSKKKSSKSAISEQGRLLKIYEDIYQVFCRLLANQPAILVADDFHLADYLTVDALRYILQAKEKPRAVWALAFEDTPELKGNSDSGKSCPDTLSEKLKLPVDQTITLGGFDRVEIKQYLEHVFAGQLPPSEFCDYLIKNTGGMPLFIEQSLLELLEARLIEHRLGAWSFPSELADFSISTGFKEFLQRRLKTVSEDARQFLRILSLSQGDLPLDLISSLLGKTEKEARYLSDELSGEGLILPEEIENQLQVKLSHSDLALQLQKELPSAEIRQIRGQIVEKLKESGRWNHWSGEIARQLYDSGEMKQVPEWAMRAAKLSRSTFLNDQALQYCHLGLEALEKSKGPIESQAQMRLLVSELENLSGHIYEAIESLEDFSKKKGNQLQPELSSRLMENLAIAYERKGELVEAATYWERAIKGKKDAERARMLGNVGWIRFRLGEVEPALEICQNSLKELDTISNADGKAFIHNTLGRIYFYSGDFEKAREHWQNCMELRQRNGDKKGLADSHNNLGIVLSSQGELEEAKRHFETALKLSREVGDFLRLNGLLVNLGIMAFEVGDLDLAERRYSEALEFFRRCGSDRELLDCLNNLGEINFLRAEYGTARNLWEECLHICGMSGYVQGTIEPLTYLATLHISCNSLTAGAEYLDRARDIAEGTQALKEQALILEQRGRIAFCKRKFEEAKEHLTSAFTTFTEMKMVFLSARLQLKLCELAWYEGKKSEYTKILKRVEKEFSDQESRWLKAEFNRIKGFDLRSDDTEGALDLAIQFGQAFPDLLWRAYWLQGRYYHLRRSYGSAGQNYQKAIDTIKKILELMPDDLKSAYSQNSDIALLRENAMKLKTEIMSARSKNHE